MNLVVYWLMVQKGYYFFLKDYLIHFVGCLLVFYWKKFAIIFIKNHLPDHFNIFYEI